MLGDGIEAVVRAKHRRRLARRGWEHALTPAAPGVFAAGDPPPRAGCALEVLIDGAVALPEIARALAQATDHVHIAGWHVAPGF
ncbi:MAG: phospholipase D-like domain-containing protein, partial [Solirubrobacteraceae bacterium]